VKWAYSLNSYDGLSALTVTFLFMFSFFCHVVGTYATSSIRIFMLNSCMIMLNCL